MSQQHRAARKLPERSNRGFPKGIIWWNQANAAGSLPPVLIPLLKKGARGRGCILYSSNLAATTRCNILKNKNNHLQGRQESPYYSQSGRAQPMQMTPLESSRGKNANNCSQPAPALLSLSPATVASDTGRIKEFC